MSQDNEHESSVELSGNVDITDPQVQPEPTVDAEENKTTIHTLKPFTGEQTLVGVMSPENMVRAKRGEHDVYDGALVVPSATLEQSVALMDVLNDVKDDDPLVQTADGAGWLLTTGISSLLHENNEIRQKALGMGEWGNYVEHLTQRLRAGRPSFGGGNQPLTGARAAAKVAAVTSTGGVIQIPLWKAGFWVSMKAPGDAQLNETRLKCEQQKEEFGRRSGGRTHSLTDVYSRKPLIDLAISCIYDATVVFQDPRELFDLIPFDEHDDLLWGLGLSLYSQGFPMIRSCLSDIGKCLHVERKYVDLSDLQRVRNDRLTVKQRIHMSNRTKRHSLEEIAAYRAEFLQSEGEDGLGVFRYKNMAISIVEPSIARWADDGFAWVRELELSVEAAFTGKMSAKERDAFITEQAGLASLRQYGHYATRITFYDEKGEEDGFIEDPLEVQTHLGSMTTDSEFNQKFLEHIDRFLTARTVTTIAIWNYVCPACGSKQLDASTDRPYLIPISPIKTFFTILTHKLKQTRLNASV